MNKLTSDDGTYFYVIVVPLVLHFLIPAIRLVQQHVNIVFVLNGISPVEEGALRKEFPDIPTLRPWTFPKSIWPHGYLLSLLLRNSNCDFGILDHDFFLFNPSALSNLQFSEKEFSICVNTWTNSRSGQLFPCTHMLYIKVALIQDIMKRYAVDAQLYKRIPKNVQPVLKVIGLSLNNPPKEYQSFFDSFLMLSALATKEGFKVQVLNIPDYDYMHVGGTSIGLQSTKEPVHHYVSARLLDLLSDNKVIKLYHRKGLVTVENVELLRTVIEPWKIAKIDLLINRIS